MKPPPRWRAWLDIAFAAIASAWVVIGIISHDAYSLCMAILMITLVNRR